MTHPPVRIARSDGLRIAYASTGAGATVVREAHWLGRLDFDPETPVWGPWIDAISRRLERALLVSPQLASLVQRPHEKHW